MNKHISWAAVSAAVVLGGISASQAAVLSVAGGLSSVGGAPGIIVAPADVTSSGAFNTGIQAFDEQQSYTLIEDLSVDAYIIPEGQVVDSHMIFLNSEDGSPIAHGALGNASVVSFTFDGLILGVMSDALGILEASSQFLGAAGTVYPAGPSIARGMDNNLDVVDPDFYVVAGNTISLGMGVVAPGDRIRVVTASAVPLPASILLLGSALAGLGVLGRRRRTTA